MSQPKKRRAESQFLRRLHSVAEVISRDGVHGAEEAAAILGPNVALAMLVYDLHLKHNRGKWPEDIDTAAQVDRQLKERGIISD